MGVGAAIGMGAMAAGSALKASANDSSSSSHPVQVNRMTPEQVNLLQNLSETINEQVGEGAEAYPGTVVPEMSEIEKTLQGYGQGFGEEALPSMQETGLNLLQGEEWEPERVEDTWQKTVFDPAMQKFQSDIIPAISEKYAGSNSLSSSAFNRAMAKSAEDMKTQTQSQLANMMFSSWQDHQNRNLQRQQIGQGILNQSLAGANQLQQIGQLSRQLEQAGLQEEAKKWSYEQPYNNPWLARLGGGPLGTYPYGHGQVSQSQAGGGKTEMIGAGLSSLGTMMGGMGAGA